jgi:hypothetical protein
MRRPRDAVFLLVLAAAAACSGAPARKTADAVTCYYGWTSFFSPDGRLPYHKAETALRREVLQDGALVRETIARPGPAPGMPPELTVIELRRRDRSLFYDAGGAFAGTVLFKSPRLAAWSLDLKAQAGGSLTGSGKASSSTYRARQLISGTARPMLLQVELSAVTGEEHEARLREMRPLPGAE